MKTINAVLTMVFFFFLIACGPQKIQVIQKFDIQVADIQTVFAPDLSVEVLNVKLEWKNGGWIIRGETTVKKVHSMVIALADSLLGQNAYENRFKLLPDSQLGDSTFAIVKVSVANLRKNPEHSAELVDQSILGETVRILQRKGSWLQVQTGYGYVGWIQGGSLKRTDEAGVKNWESREKVRVTRLYGSVYSKPDPLSEPVADLVLNAILAIEKRGVTWTKVGLPDEAAGFVETVDLADDHEVRMDRDTRVEKIVRTARSMMGIPYLWGGNSSKANDCSGYTQTVFKACGIQLPRDARQQARKGEKIVPDSSFSNVLPGDLFFFGVESRITHVGISLGGAEFIHQSSRVHVNSLDPQKEHFNAFRKQTLKQIKRIF